MADKYLSRNDVSLRLNNCVGIYKGEFCRIFVPERDDAAPTHVILRKLTTNDLLISRTIDANTDALVVSGLPLGYMTDENGPTWYVSRVPVRRQSEGINSANLVMSRVDTPRISGQVGNGTISSKGFEKMLKGEYRPFDEVKAIALEAPVGWSEAISRSCALLKTRKGVSLFFENSLVGFFDEPMVFVNLLEDYRHSVMVQKLSKVGGFFVNA